MENNETSDKEFREEVTLEKLNSIAKDLIENYKINESELSIIKLTTLILNQQNTTNNIINGIQDLLLNNIRNATKRGEISDDQRALMRDILNILKEGIDEHAKNSQDSEEIIDQALGFLKKDKESTGASK